MTCPLCGETETVQRVIFLGFPMKLCECSCLFGFWSWLPGLVGPMIYGGEPAWKFLVYGDNSYLSGLRMFLFGPPEGEDDDDEVDEEHDPRWDEDEPRR